MLFWVNLIFIYRNVIISKHDCQGGEDDTDCAVLSKLNIYIQRCYHFKAKHDGQGGEDEVDCTVLCIVNVYTHRYVCVHCVFQG